MTRALTKLLKRLDLPRTDDWTFEGGAGTGGTTEAARLFGGLVVAQATVAAARTVEPPLYMHSLHAMFLRPGRPNTSTRLHVEPIKEGRNYRARLVTVRQGDGESAQTIFQMQASFGRFSAGVEHQDPMPEVAPPEEALDRDVLRGRSPDAMPIKVRMLEPLNETTPSPPHMAVWLKPNGELPADPVLRLATLVYATDRAFLGTAWRPHVGRGRLGGASLDHSLWFHDRIAFDDWLLFTMHSPRARSERGLVFGGLYDRTGQRIASAAQEGAMTLG